MIEDKIKAILATETSDTYKIDRLSDSLLALFKENISDYTSCVVKGILKGEIKK